MTTTHPRNAAQIIKALDFVEVGVPDVGPDGRRVLMAERDRVSAAVQRGDAAEIRGAIAHAIEVGEMWGVDLTA